MRILPGAAAKPPVRASRVRQQRLARARAEFGAAYLKLYARACRAVAKYAGDSSEDVVQNAFLEMWNACYRKGELPKETPRALLYRILRARMIDHVRSDRSANAGVLDFDEIDEVGEGILNPMDTRRVADGRLLQARLDYLLASMPAKSAEAFRLSTRMHRDPEAIAQELGVTRDTARWHVWDAKRRLKQALKNEYVVDDEGDDSGETA